MDDISQRTVVSTFASPHEPMLKPKVCKRASVFRPKLPPLMAVLGLPTLKKQNKLVLRG